VNRGPLDRLATTASLVFIADFATKQWALRTLPIDGDRPLGAGWHLAIINNTHLAGGFESGGFELPLTAILTTIIAVMVLRICRPLTAVDGSAPTMLGLLVGAGAANFADALIPPHGVVDFITFATSTGIATSFNVADVVLAFALVLCVRTMWRIGQTMRGRVVPASRARHAQLSGALLMRDRVLLSAGHALLAMCGFVWLYSMALALTPDAGRSAPNSLLCGVAVFAVAFVASQARLRIADRRVAGNLRSVPTHALERLVLDGSVPVVGTDTEAPPDRLRPVPRGDRAPRDERQQPSRDSGIA
jgi:lipoprotein signal peptidase